MKYVKKFEGYSSRLSFEILIGKTLDESYQVGIDKFIFETSDGDQYTLNGLGTSEIDEIHGEISDILDSKIIFAEEIVDDSDREDIKTYHNIKTNNGEITINWFGNIDFYKS